MAASSANAAMVFVWGPGRDSPKDGYHVTPGDAGGGTYGGVTEDTWASATHRGVVTGDLKTATTDALRAVLMDGYWGSVCDTLPAGVDLLFFNGRMMSGAYPRLFQRALGMIAGDVDGVVGPMTLGVATKADAATLIRATTGTHYAYLSTLSAWKSFGIGWTRRLIDAEAAALALLHP